jgi:hypothetical protein
MQFKVLGATFKFSSSKAPCSDDALGDEGMPTDSADDFPKIRYLKELSDKQFDKMLADTATNASEGISTTDTWNSAGHDKTLEIRDLLIESHLLLSGLLMVLRDDRKILFPEIAQFWQKKGHLEFLVGLVSRTESLLEDIEGDFLELPSDPGSP